MSASIGIGVGQQWGQAGTNAYVQLVTGLDVSGRVLTPVEAAALLIIQNLLPASRYRHRTATA